MRTELTKRLTEVVDREKTRIGEENERKTLFDLNDVLLIFAMILLTLINVLLVIRAINKFLRENRSRLSRP